MTDPDRIVSSSDGTPIAVFESGAAEPGTRPLVLVHGTTADHLTFRVVGPILARRRRLFAIDRRGRGASGDGPAYAIEREFEDVAAVADAVAAEAGGPVDVLGHSFGGRCALGASLLTGSIRQVITYEGAPAPDDQPYQSEGLVGRLAAHLGRGDREAILETFMREVVGMDDAAMARFRADAVWPLRVAASPTILRELEAERSPAASLDALGRVTVPVLQVLGAASVPAFHAATEALAERLIDGRVALIEGAAHAAHHTHPDAFVTAVEAFLDDPDVDRAVTRSTPMIEFNSLRRAVRGMVIEPGSSEFDERRRTFNAMIDRRPAVIVVPIDTADVVAAVRWAGDHDLPISIRGGGHSVAGHSVGNGSLMLDLGRMRAVHVDPEAEDATVQGGAKLEDLDRATAAHGLAAPSGTYSDTGIGGLALGGGLSYLLASRGLACDALVGATLVTADGSTIEVDEAREPELLWALRGGGGNFGVVTAFRLALAPLGSVYMGRIRFPGSSARELLQLLFEFDAAAPDALTTQGVLWHAPTLGTGVTIIAAWLGDAAAGETILAPFRERPDVTSDESRPITYLELQAVFERMGPTYRHYWKGHFVGRADDGLVDALLDAHQRMPLSEGLILIEPMHGMVHRIPEASAAFGARRAVANVSSLAIWSDPADDDAQIGWARESVASWEPWSLQGGGYVNYTPADETATRIEQIYGAERFARLRAVKRRTDPDNRFRFNANIPPA